ncbi:MAG: PKD domain-containing protein [Syntrophomonadaceae bacterium]
MNPWSVDRRLLLCCLALALPALVLPAATYLPMSDADLVAKAPIVARATVMATEARLESIGGEERPFTLVTFSLVEAIKGFPSSSFVVRLAGGKVGDNVWWVPGTPVFSAGEDVVLMLAPHPAYPGELRLTEFGLSRFDLVSDDNGRRFAVRPAFTGIEDLAVSKRSASPGAPAGERDAESFLAFLRAAARGEPAGDVAYAAPVLAATKWANIGGREPGDCSGTPCLFRWFWDSGDSPNAVLTVNGTQSNLVGTDEPTCGTDSMCDVQNAATGWHGVASTDIRVSGPTTPGNITVNLDATSSQDNGTTWNTALGCSGGTIGLGGPGSGRGPRTYRGDANYFYPSNGTVNMRKVTCARGYSAATFRTAVLHEVGHVLGLAHPDQDESIHSTTGSNDWNSAVMHSVVPPSKPDTPQTDDVQAMQYYYGTVAAGAMPVANFNYAPASPTVGQTVTFSDASTGGATGWNWDFGDPSSSSNTATAQNPTHVFSEAKTYTVTLTAGSLNGSSTPIARQLTIAQGGGDPGNCVVDPLTLCLNGGRFKTTITWQKTDGTSGSGTGVGLTSDSGYFWFFSDTNIETVVKVLNACGLNNHYWVFAAGLTNVLATLTIVDEHTGAQKQYVNPQGTPFAPIQETGAFATCP